MRDREPHIVVRRIHVELRGEHVRVGHPAADIIVDRDLRIPVAHEIDVVPLSALASIGRRLRRHVGPGQLQPRAVVRDERSSQRDPHHGAVDDVPAGRGVCSAGAGDGFGGDTRGRGVHQVAGDEDRAQGDAAGDFGFLVAGTAGREDILAEVDRDLPDRVGRVIEVGDALVAGNAVGGDVEAAFDRVSRVLDPVVFARGAGARASAAVHRAGELRDLVDRPGHRAAAGRRHGGVEGHRGARLREGRWSIGGAEAHSGDARGQGRQRGQRGQRGQGADAERAAGQTIGEESHGVGK